MIVSITGPATRLLLRRIRRKIGRGDSIQWSHADGGDFDHYRMYARGLDALPFHIGSLQFKDALIKAYGKPTFIRKIISDTNNLVFAGEQANRTKVVYDYEWPAIVDGKTITIKLVRAGIFMPRCFLEVPFSG